MSTKNLVNMGDMAKSPLLQFFFLSFSLLFGLNPSSSKTVRGTGLKFCTQVGFDDLMCSDLSKCYKQCSLHVNNNNAFPQYIIKGTLFCILITGYQW